MIVGNTGNWEIIIGLEVHAQVKSQAKLFSGASTSFGASPNSQVSFIDAAMPGMLPVLNKFCIEQAVKTGLGLNAEINRNSRFDRKNYFYPDLPQGYQISQFYEPVVKEGYLQLDLENESKKVRLERIHLEQDAGKSLHEHSPKYTFIDLNRCGIALMEIVSKPDLRSSEEAVSYMKKLRSILRYLGTCDGDMEKGSLRCDANVSVRKEGATEFGTRCEIKNLNSIRSISRAIEHEAERQVTLLESGGTVEQETRLYDANKNETRVMRSKEDALDYRYFPDPDLLPIKLSEEYIEKIQNSLPELPDEKKKRYINNFGLSDYDAGVLTAEKEISEFYEKLVAKVDPKLAANWFSIELFGRLNKAGLSIEESPVSTEQLIELIDLISDNTISGKIAKDVLDIMFETGKNAGVIIEEKGLKQITNPEEIRPLVKDVIANNPEKVEQYKAGKEKLFGFFVGQVMKQTGGKANPDLVNQILKEELV